MNHPRKGTLSSLAFSGNKGVAVGSWGIIISTADDGRTWTDQVPDRGEGIGSISFADPEHGLAIGQARILWSNNGGTSWTKSKTLPAENTWSGRLLNDTTAVAVGNDGVIFRTTDMGATWDQVVTGADYGISGMKFVDENRGLAVGWSTILSTEDGGRTWTRRPIPPTVGDCYLVGLACSDKKRWLVVGAGGVILASEDSGRTWKSQASPVKKSLQSVAWSDSHTATIVGDRGLILQSIDGSSWTERKSGTSFRLNAVEYVSPSIGFAVGQFGTVLRTDDGGRTWHPEKSHTLNHLWRLTWSGKSIFAVGLGTTILRRQVKPTSGGTN